MSHHPWKTDFDGSCARPSPPTTVMEASKGGLANFYVVRQGGSGGEWQIHANGWRMSDGGPWHTCQSAMDAADAHALAVQAEVGPSMVGAIGLRRADWRVDFERPGLWLRHTRHEDVSMFGLGGMWTLYLRDEVLEVDDAAVRAVRALDRPEVVAELETLGHRSALAAFARETCLPQVNDDTHDWTALLDVRGRLVMADAHGTGATYAEAVGTGYVVRDCRTLELLDPSASAPGASAVEVTHATPEDAYAEMRRRNGFSPPSPTM